MNNAHSAKSRSLIEKIRNIEDEATGDAFVEFRLQKVRGGCTRVVVPRAQADDVKHLLNLFIGKNADLPADKEKAIFIGQKCYYNSTHQVCAIGKTCGLAP